MRNPLASMIMLLLAGCAAVGPDYEPPVIDAPDQFIEAPDNEPSELQQDQRFWRGFDDPTLAGLISQVMESNKDLDVALARYDRAHALLRGARSDRLPSIGASASAAAQHLAAAEQTRPGADDDIEVYQVGANVSWEIDLFGRLRRSTEAQSARLEVAQAEMEALEIALVGQVASSYFELRGLQQQLTVAEQNVRLQRESLAIVESRATAGQGNRFDTLRAKAQLENTLAVIPDLQASIRTRMHRVAVLTGQSPDSLIAELSVPGTLPASMPLIPVDSPVSVLRRRPDIRSAERTLAAATADIGIATADLFPRFSLDALIGSVAIDSSGLFSSAAESRRIALGVDWTFLDFGRVRSRIDASNAQARAALAEYEQTVLEALEETENYLVRYYRAQHRTERLTNASTATSEAAALARTRYEQGYVSYFEVLGAERDLLNTESALEQSRLATALAMVNLYRTLAGPPHSVEATAALH